MSLLRLENISKYYSLKGNEKVKALNNINCEFNKGELVAIIGESGSGKSTLMNIIGGLDSSFTGDLLIENENISTFSEKQLDEYRKNKIGFIFQSFNLIPHLSILDNVIMPLKLMNINRKKCIERGKKILAEVGLENHINKRPNQLSGGQKQRVAIARAIINNPDIIIADEPTGNLDSKTTEQILKLIERIVSSGKLVIMVTHSEKVASHANRIIEIQDGSIVKDSKCKLNTNQYISDDEFIKGRIRNKNLTLPSALKLALLNMKEKLLKNMLVSFGGSIGIMSIIIMMSFGNGVKSYLNNTMNSYVNESVIEVSIPDENQEVYVNDMAIEKPNINNINTFKDDDLKKLNNINGVSSIEEGYNLISIGANSISSDYGGCNLMRISTVSSNITASNVKNGSLPKRGEVLISESISDKLGDNIIGKEVKLKLLIGDSKVEKDYLVSGIYASSAADLNSIIKSAFINFEDLKEMYEENNLKLKPNVVYITAKDESDIKSIKDDIKALGYEISSQEEMIKLFSDMITILTYALASISGFSLIVSSIMIFVVLYMSIIERTREIGILKSIGARRKDVRRIFVSEAVVLGAISGCIGIIASFIIVSILNNVSGTILNINLAIIKYEYLILGFFLSLLLSILSGIFPAYKAARLDPVESLRRE